jgi:hypothetical protein
VRYLPFSKKPLMLACRPHLMRVAGRYENSGYNGRG